MHQTQTCDCGSPRVARTPVPAPSETPGLLKAGSKGSNSQLEATETSEKQGTRPNDWRYADFSQPKRIRWYTNEKRWRPVPLVIPWTGHGE